jgi:hypothetical protein
MQGVQLKKDDVGLVKDDDLAGFYSGAKLGGLAWAKPLRLGAFAPRMACHRPVTKFNPSHPSFKLNAWASWASSSVPHGSTA